MSLLANLPNRAHGPLALLRRLGVSRLTIALAVLLAVVLGIVGYRETSTPQFCRSCHEMGYYYDTWRHSSHQPINCEECHLGANVKDMIITKIGAMKEIMVHSAKRPVAAQVPRKANVADAVCRKCHEPPRGDLVYHQLRITHDAHLARGMHCQECHSNVVHGGRTGFINTPSMAGCLKCHNGDKAPNNCNLCHLKLGEINQPAYNPAWVQAHRDNLTTIGREACKSCHGEQFCTSCHQSVPPHGPGWLNDHQKTKQTDLQRCATCHQPRTGEAMALFCIDCHNAKRAHGPQYVLTHPQDFQQRSETCRLCHQQNFCASCHNIYRPHPLDWLAKHGKESKTGKSNCATCHPRRSCEECHTHGRPPSHTNEWRHKHGQAAAADDQNCSQCHTRQMCRQCHQTNPPSSHRQPAWPLRAHGAVAQAEPKFCKICHDQQDCSRCHGGIQMPHPTDWRKAHSQTAAARSRQVCLKCHKVEDCNTCHRGSMPASHQTNWVQRHGKIAASRSANCYFCHENRLCAACHALPMPHPSGWSKPQAHGRAAQSQPDKCATCHQRTDCLRCHGRRPPASHRQPDFQSQHASQGPDGVLCSLCHGRNSCQSCHQGVAMPHSGSFRAGGHGKVAQNNPGACGVCHKDKKFCQNCHAAMPPSSHAAASWKSAHGKGDKRLCTMCHGANACTACHQSLKKSPHADDWAMTHKAKAKFDKSANCFMCHKIDYCQQCHPDAKLK